MESSGLIDLFIWLLALQLLAFAILPLVASFFPDLEPETEACRNVSDAGYGLSKLMGFFVFALLCWLPAAWGVVSVTREWVTLVFLVVLLLGYYQWVLAPNAASTAARLRRVVTTHFLQVEGIFFGLTLLFLYIRFLNPEIFWGEKPMDSTFLHFFTRNSVVPPQDPWGVGHTMSYYYVGLEFLATVLKLTGIPPAVGFNLAIATLAGWIGCALYSTFHHLLNAKWLAAFAAVILVLSSDPEVLRLSVFEKRQPNFDTFWASTRVLTSPNFFEYTSWSLLFADLHAHVVAIPFTVALITCSLVAWSSPAYRYFWPGVGLRLTMGALLGALYAANTWDVITFGSVVAVLFLLSPTSRLWDPPVSSKGRVLLRERIVVETFSRLVAWSWDAILLVLPFLLVSRPYARQSGARGSINWGWVTEGEFNTLAQVVCMLGYWFALLVVAMSILAALRTYNIKSVFVMLGVVVMVSIALLFVTNLNEWQSGTDVHPWGLLAFGAVLSGVLMGSAAVSSFPRERLGFLLGALGAAFIVVLEEVFLIDRMNTLFKGYMAVWMLLGISSLTVAFRMLVEARRQSGLSGAFLAFIPIGVILVLSGIGSVLNMYGIVTMQRIVHRHHTLDGAAYLAEHSPGDSVLTDWLNANVKGSPTVLEAHGDAYGPFTRIAMFTGLPTVLGWEHHVKQRGLSPREVEERKEAIRTIYSTKDLLLAQMLLLRYRVEFIVVGALERRQYGEKGLEKFFQHPELFTPVASGAGATLFVTKYSDYHREKIEGKQLL